MPGLARAYFASAALAVAAWALLATLVYSVPLHAGLVLAASARGGAALLSLGAAAAAGAVLTAVLALRLVALTLRLASLDGACGGGARASAESVATWRLRPAQCRPCPTHRPTSLTPCPRPPRAAADQRASTPLLGRLLQALASPAHAAAGAAQVVLAVGCAGLVLDLAVPGGAAAVNADLLHGAAALARTLFPAAVPSTAAIVAPALLAFLAAALSAAYHEGVWTASGRGSPLAPPPAWTDAAALPALGAAAGGSRVAAWVARRTQGRVGSQLRTIARQVTVGTVRGPAAALVVLAGVAVATAATRAAVYVSAAGVSLLLTHATAAAGRRLLPALLERVLAGAAAVQPPAPALLALAASWAAALPLSLALSFAVSAVAAVEAAVLPVMLSRRPPTLLGEIAAGVPLAPVQPLAVRGDTAYVAIPSAAAAVGGGSAAAGSKRAGAAAGGPRIDASSIDTLAPAVTNVVSASGATVVALAVDSLDVKLTALTAVPAGSLAAYFVGPDHVAALEAAVASGQGQGGTHGPVLYQPPPPSQQQGGDGSAADSAAAVVISAAPPLSAPAAAAATRGLSYREQGALAAWMRRLASGEVALWAGHAGPAGGSRAVPAFPAALMPLPPATPGVHALPPLSLPPLLTAPSLLPSLAAPPAAPSPWALALAAAQHLVAPLTTPTDPLTGAPRATVSSSTAAATAAELVAHPSAPWVRLLRDGVLCGGAGAPPSALPSRDFIRTGGGSTGTSTGTARGWCPSAGGSGLTVGERGRLYADATGATWRRALWEVTGVIDAVTVVLTLAAQSGRMLPPAAAAAAAVRAGELATVGGGSNAAAPAGAGTATVGQQQPVPQGVAAPRQRAAQAAQQPAPSPAEPSRTRATSIGAAAAATGRPAALRFGLTGVINADGTTGLSATLRPQGPAPAPPAQQQPAAPAAAAPPKGGLLSRAGATVTGRVTGALAAAYGRAAHSVYRAHRRYLEGPEAAAVLAVAGQTRPAHPLPALLDWIRSGRAAAASSAAVGAPRPAPASTSGAGGSGSSVGVWELMGLAHLPHAEAQAACDAVTAAIHAASLAAQQQQPQQPSYLGTAAGGSPGPAAGQGLAATRGRRGSRSGTDALGVTGLAEFPPPPPVTQAPLARRPAAGRGGFGGFGGPKRGAGAFGALSPLPGFDAPAPYAAAAGDDGDDALAALLGGGAARTPGTASRPRFGLAGSTVPAPPGTAAAAGATTVGLRFRGTGGPGGIELLPSSASTSAAAAAGAEAYATAAEDGGAGGLLPSVLAVATVARVALTATAGAVVADVAEGALVAPAARLLRAVAASSPAASAVSANTGDGTVSQPLVLSAGGFGGGDAGAPASRLGRLLRTLALRACLRSPADEMASLLGDYRAAVAAVDMLASAVAASRVEDRHGVVSPTLPVAVACLSGLLAGVGLLLSSPRYAASMAAPGVWEAEAAWGAAAPSSGGGPLQLADALTPVLHAAATGTTLRLGGPGGVGSVAAASATGTTGVFAPAATRPALAALHLAAVRGLRAIRRAFPESYDELAAQLPSPLLTASARAAVVGASAPGVGPGGAR